MNILTKIAVVVLVVLVLLACPVFIRIATVGPNYRDKFEREELKNAVLVANNEAANMALTEMKRQRDDLLLKQKESAVESAQRISRLEGEVQAEKITNSDLRAQLARLNTSYGKLDTSLEREIQARKDALQAADNSRKQVDIQNVQIRQLDAALKENQANVKSLELTAKSLREEIAELNDQLVKAKEALAVGGAAPSAVGEVAMVTEDKIIGSVTAVDKDTASVNVGSAKGLRRGMVMVIYRGDQFISHLRLETVDPSEAAGILFDKKAEPAPGDRAATPAALR